MMPLCVYLTLSPPKKISISLTVRYIYNILPHTTPLQKIPTIPLNFETRYAKKKNITIVISLLIQFDCQILQLIIIHSFSCGSLGPILSYKAALE